MQSINALSWDLSGLFSGSSISAWRQLSSSELSAFTIAGTCLGAGSSSSLMDAFQHGDPEADGVTPYSITTSDARTGCAVTLDRTGTVITCTNGALYGAGQNLHGWVSMGPTTATSVRSAASADGATTSYAQPTCASAAPLSGDAPRDPDGHQGIFVHRHQLWHRRCAARRVSITGVPDSWRRRGAAARRHRVLHDDLQHGTLVHDVRGRRRGGVL